jgi:hypothetical protein
MSRCYFLLDDIHGDDYLDACIFHNLFSTTIDAQMAHLTTTSSALTKREAVELSGLQLPVMDRLVPSSLSQKLGT